jgi:hypothetical protein
MADNFASMTNPDGECCGTDAPACPTYTVRVLPVGSTSPAGLAVALAGTLNGQPWTAGGTTGDDGTYTYTMPDSAPYPVVTSATVVAPDVGPSKGCTASVKFGSACSKNFIYCRIAVKAAFTVAAAPRLTTDDVFNVPGLAGWSMTRDDNAGVAVWDSCCLRAGDANTNPGTNGPPLCPSPNRNVRFTATTTLPPIVPPDALAYPPYLARCQVVNLTCGVVADIDLTQEASPACYKINACGAAGCRSNLGPPYVGAMPRNVSVRLTSKPGAPGSGCAPLFAGDDGQWIPLINWDSGMRGGAGNYVSAFWYSGITSNTAGSGNGCNYNCPCPTFDPRYYGSRCATISYASTRVTIQVDKRSDQLNTLDVVYTRYAPASNVDSSDPYPACKYAPAYNDPHGDPKFWLPPYWQTYNSANPIPYQALCVPVPATVYDCGDFYVEFRDDCGGSNPYSDPYSAPAVAMAPRPLAAPAPALVPLDESIRLTRAASKCPHRTAPSCGCASVPGSCALGKGGASGVTLADCIACQRDDVATIHAHLSSYTGYGQLAAELGRGLEALGHPVGFEAIDIDPGGFVPLDEFVKRRIRP